MFVHRKRLLIAVALGVTEFNYGSTASLTFVKSLNLPIGAEMKRLGTKRDRTRTFKSEKAATEKAKRFRILKAEAKQKEEMKLKERYGEFYKSGGGD